MHATDETEFAISREKKPPPKTYMWHENRLWNSNAKTRDSLLKSVENISTQCVSCLHMWLYLVSHGRLGCHGINMAQCLNSRFHTQEREGLRRLTFRVEPSDCSREHAWIHACAQTHTNTCTEMGWALIRYILHFPCQGPLCRLMNASVRETVCRSHEKSNRGTERDLNTHTHPHRHRLCQNQNVS